MLVVRGLHIPGIDLLLDRLALLLLADWEGGGLICGLHFDDDGAFCRDFTGKASEKREGLSIQFPVVMTQAGADSSAYHVTDLYIDWKTGGLFAPLFVDCF